MLHRWSHKFSSGQPLRRVRLFAIPCIAACQVSCPSTTPGSFLKLISIESMMPSSHCLPLLCLPCCPPFSCPQSFPASGSFPMSQLFESGGQRIGASASVLPINSQGWFPLGLTGLISLLSKGLLISLLSKGLLEVFSSTTVRKH